MTWVRQTPGGYVNMDRAVTVSATGSGSTWQIQVRLDGDATARTLDGTFSTQADAETAARELVNGVTVADLT